MPSSRYTNWLIKESRLWVADGVIDAATAEQIRSRYPAAGMSWGLFLLTAIGAIVFGLGIILFFAYNWDDLPKFAKLALIFAALIFAHLIALVIGHRKPDNQNLVEGFHVLGTMMFGAGIWLVAQIYHVDEHYPTAFALWGAGALILAWALPSVIQGLIAAVLLTVWGMSEVADFNSLHLLSIALLVFGVMGLAYNQRSRVLLFFGLVGTLAMLVGNVTVHADVEVIYFLLFAIAVLLIALARLARASRFPESGDVLRTIGIMLYGCLLLLTTFEFITVDLLDRTPSGIERAVAVGGLAVAAVCWGMLMFSFISAGVSMLKILEIILVLIATLAMLVLALGLFKGATAISMLLFNAVLAAHCILLIIIGTDELNWRHIAIGCFTLGLLIFWRFNDMFHSLLMRSLVFLIVGAILFFIGHIYSKHAKRRLADA